MLEKIRVLQTTVGGLTSPGIIDAIKDNGEREVFLVGVDPVAHVRGAYQVDKFSTVTASFQDERRFIDELLQIVADERIQAILPCGNEDCLAIARRRSDFESLGARVALSPLESLGCGFDKAGTYEVLAAHVPEAAPRYRVVSDSDSFEAALRDMGYPDTRVVVKPRQGRGGRGVMVLDPDSSMDRLLNRKADVFYPGDTIVPLFRRAQTFPDVVVMEYLPGTLYSVYALCDRGTCLAAVPNIRLWGTPSQTLRGKVEMDPRAMDTAGKVVKAFNFSHNINFEAGVGSDGRLVVYDVNPRLAASTACVRAAGANLIYLSIKLALGEQFEVPRIRDGVLTIRYFREMHIEGDRVFEYPCSHIRSR